MPDFSFIDNGLVLGNAYCVTGNYATQDPHVLDELGINTVVSILTEYEYDDYMITQDDFPNMEWHRLVLDDETNEDISKYFYMVHLIIQSALKEKKRILVHCAAGISRSASLVIAYLMIENKWTYEEAYHYLQKRRPQINPNSGFVKQLKKLELSSLNIG
jgi:protein-tyrosine phosphatase